MASCWKRKMIRLPTKMRYTNWVNYYYSHLKVGKTKRGVVFLTMPSFFIIVCSPVAFREPTEHISHLLKYGSNSVFSPSPLRWKMGSNSLQLIVKGNGRFRTGNLFPFFFFIVTLSQMVSYLLHYSYILPPICMIMRRLTHFYLLWYCA